MKRLKLIMIALVLVSLSVSSYAQKVYRDGNYFVVDATGMPAAAVKTAAEVAGTIDPATGIVYRHTYTSGNAGNPNVDAKVSPKFAVSPKDISISGTETGGAMNWMQASGWRNDGTTTSDGVYGNLNASGVVATTATGCKAYAGPVGGEAGQWRLPTQRELMLIWVLHAKLRLLSGFNSFTSYDYWSATESSAFNSWYVYFTNGYTYNVTTKTYSSRVRCVRDL